MNPKTISPCETSSLDCDEAPYLKIEVEDDVFEQYIITKIPKDTDQPLTPHNPFQSTDERPIADDALESNMGQAPLSYSSHNAGRYSKHRDQQDIRPEMRAISHQEAYRLIMKRAVMYLSRREYTQHTLKTKLSKAFETLTIKTANETHFATEDPADMHTANHLGLNAQVSELIESVMSYLAQHNWQSDQRCAEHMSQVKGQRYGSKRVKHLLAQEGVDKALIEQTVQNLNQTERQRAVSVWRKKFGVQPKNAAEYAKQMRFMAYRGFSFELINQILKAHEDTLSDWDECNDYNEHND